MKRERPWKLTTLLLYLLAGSLLFACGGGGAAGVGQGSLATALTDSSTDQYRAVYVTIARVEVHHDGADSWQTVASPNRTYNLLELVNGVRETLGIDALNAGHYTQLRLIIGSTPDAGLNLFSVPHPYANYFINLADEVHELKVPSGANTGLKVVNGFDIAENRTTELLLDFDAMRSVVRAGSSGNFLLKPTVKVLDTTDSAIVSGLVADAGTALPIVPGGGLVTAQVAAPASPDPKDQVIIEAGTLTNANAEYTLFLAPGDYNLVASQTGYLPGCTAVSLQAAETTVSDFSLDAVVAAPGTISGTVTIAGATGDQHVTLDVRQAVTCSNGSGPTMITLVSVNIADGGTYAVDLPAGDYQLVASTFNGTTLTATAIVTSGATTPLDIAF